VARYTSSGALDTNFGNDDVYKIPGIYIVDMGGGDDEPYAVTILSDGKILVAGKMRTAGRDDILILKFTTGGKIDNSFGPGGWGYVDTHAGVSNSVARGIIVQSGSIYVAGSASPASGNQDFVVCKYDSSGTLENSFGVSGIAYANVGGGTVTDTAYAMAIRPGVGIVLAGYSAASPDTFSMARFDFSGSLDSNFGSGGMVLCSFGDKCHAYGVALETHGGILMAGEYFNTSVGTDFDFMVARYW
jgi:uncharacterized delta-60 repeat protein